MNVIARDQGKPVRTAQAQIIINVQRNQYPPVFDKSVYQITISENVRNGTGIGTIKATDADIQGAMTYEVTGTPPAPKYFRVGRDTGFLFISGDVLSDFSLTYTVSEVGGNSSTAS